MNDYKHYLQHMVAALLRMSYQVRVSVLNASSFGDPQHRKRVFLWASREDCMLPKLPLPSYGPSYRFPFNTSRGALGALEEYQAMQSRASGAISACSNSSHTIHNHICPGFSIDKGSYALQENEPSRTVLARARPHVHYKLLRYITVREAACLPSFPTTFQFFGSLAKQYSQVGNAVPLCMAIAVARSVAEVHGLP